MTIHRRPTNLMLSEQEEHAIRAVLAQIAASSDETQIKYIIAADTSDGSENAIADDIAQYAAAVLRQRGRPLFIEKVPGRGRMVGS